MNMNMLNFIVTLWLDKALLLDRGAMPRISFAIFVLSVEIVSTLK